MLRAAHLVYHTCYTICMMCTSKGLSSLHNKSQLIAITNPVAVRLHCWQEPESHTHICCVCPLLYLHSTYFRSPLEIFAHRE